MRVHFGMPWAWGKELHPFCGDGLWHIGFLHLRWRLTARDYARINTDNNRFWGNARSEEGK